MKRISSCHVGIDQGSKVLFSDFADGGAMWTGQGPRESRAAVTFPKPFHAPPAVIVGISLMDLDHSTNMRTAIMAETVTAAGFDIVFRTWGDTRIARVRAEWTAVGSVRDEDDWDVT